MPFTFYLKVLIIKVRLKFKGFCFQNNLLAAREKNMSEILETLFGSRIRVRLLRFFLLNQEGEYLMSEIAKRNMIAGPQVKKELNELKKIKFIDERSKKNEKRYTINPKFYFLPEMASLMAKANASPQCKSLAKIKNIGDVKLFLTSGIFINNPKSKADMILVVNNINRSRLKNVIQSLEAEIGREISFMLMNGDEFKYRLDMLDRFILEFLEGPHEEVINKIPGLRRFIAGMKKY